MKEELQLLCILNNSYFTQDLLLRRRGEVSYITYNKGRNWRAQLWLRYDKI